jgi:hypothetical protein
MEAEIIRVEWERQTKPSVRAANMKRGLVYERMIELLEDEYGVCSEVIYEAYERAMCEMEYRRMGRNIVQLVKNNE